MKRILPAFLIILIALACTLANPPREPRPTMTINPTRLAEWMTETARPTLSDDELRQTQVAGAETATIISDTLTETATAIAPYIPLTQEARIATATSLAGTYEALGVDIFSLTATSLVATATANAHITYTLVMFTPIPITSTPYVSTKWPVIHFSYTEDDTKDWTHNPQIGEGIWWLSLCAACEIDLPPSHQISIHAFNATPSSEEVYLILEDAVSRLPDYPPFNPEVYENIEIVNRDMMYDSIYGSFGYSQAIAAYDTGLRGADLAEALGVAAP